MAAAAATAKVRTTTATATATTRAQPKRKPRAGRLYISAREYAELLGYCESKVWKDLRAGRIPSIKDGRNRLIPRSAIPGSAA